MRKRLTKRQWRRRFIIRRIFRVTLLTIVTFVICIVIIHWLNQWFLHKNSVLNHYEQSEFVLEDVTLAHEEEIDVQLLPINDYSRPETKLKALNGIVIHYVGNPNTTAQNNHDYFEGLAKKKTTYASSHFVIGLEGEIIQCIPLNEVAYCSNQRNDDTIAIEVCHPDTTGKFNDSTYESLVELVTYLCNMFELKVEDVIRHYDVTGKRCPLYYVDNEDAWIQFKVDVKNRLKSDIY